MERFYLHSPAPLMLLVWEVVRVLGPEWELLLAGVRRFFRPRFLPPLRYLVVGRRCVADRCVKLGVANFAPGVGWDSVRGRVGFILPVAIIAAVFLWLPQEYGMSKAGRKTFGNRNIAMIERPGGVSGLCCVCRFRCAGVRWGGCQSSAGLVMMAP